MLEFLIVSWDVRGWSGPGRLVCETRIPAGRFEQMFERTIAFVSMGFIYRTMILRSYDYIEKVKSDVWTISVR